MVSFSTLRLHAKRKTDGITSGLVSESFFPHIKNIPFNILSFFISLHQKRNGLIWLIMILKLKLNNYCCIWLQVADTFFIKHRLKLLLDWVLSNTFCLDCWKPLFTFNRTLYTAFTNYVKKDSIQLLTEVEGNS